MDGMVLLAGAAGLMSALGWAESAVHRRQLARIAVRIHVNGTRGKSGVTRLIAAGLRAGGFRTFAKVTGTLPRMILPCGAEEPVIRRGRANIIEQLGIVRKAAHRKCDALVLECMALQPHLQAVCEEKIVRSTHGVITNIRADHLEVMGPTVADVGRALAGSIPYKGVLFTAERKRLEVLAAAARDRKSKLVAVSREEAEGVTNEELAGFSYIEHAENVALALRVCQENGVGRAAALAGMQQAAADEGVMTVSEAADGDRRVTFVNGFAANDPESTETIWNLVRGRFAEVERRIAVVNCRADRPERSLQLAEMSARWAQPDRYLVIGEGCDVFLKRAVALGVNRLRITRAEGWPAENVLDETFAWAGQSALAVGVGNIGGPGLQLAHLFWDRSRTSPAMPAASHSGSVPITSHKEAA